MEKLRYYSTADNSLTFSTPPIKLQTFKSVCQRQTQHLLEHLPLSAVYIVCRHQDNQQRLRIQKQQNQPNIARSATLFYLESETWLQAQFPAFKLIQLAIPPDFSNGESQPDRPQFAINQQGDTTFVYVYFLNLAPNPDEYLLLCADTALSQPQQQYAEQQAQLLADYLIVYRQSSRQQQEIEALKQAAAQAEHQLRNPLALITLYAENICLGLPEGSLKEQAGLIGKTAQEISKNLNILRGFSQAKALRLQPKDLLGSFREALQILQPILQEKQQQISYPETSITLLIDGWQIKQVFENLLSNAIYFSPSNSTINCRWHLFKNEVLIEIADGGPGLSSQDLKQLFVPFYSRRPGGTGLGLTIAKKIIQDHQGSIWAENLSQGGAQFSFTLPRYPV